jgi:hypothetical protein
MRCPRCQHENPSGSNFCLGCGVHLGLRCASCGSDLPTGSRFCNKCGHAVGDQVSSDQRFSSPDTYTPGGHPVRSEHGGGPPARTSPDRVRRVAARGSAGRKWKDELILPTPIGWSSDSRRQRPRRSQCSPSPARAECAAPKPTSCDSSPSSRLARVLLIAHCHLGLGRLYRRIGDAAKSQEHLTRASTMYRGMDMGFWLE